MLASPGDELVRSLRSGRPTVLIDAGMRVAGMSGIDIDVVEGGRLIADHLWASGTAGLRMWASTATNRRSERREGLGARLREHDARFVVPDVASPRMAMELAYRAAEAALDTWRDAGVTAVVCADDLLAFGVLRAAQERDLAVPAAISRSPPSTTCPTPP